MPVYNKLVRDFTPTYLDRLGFDYRTRTLDEGEYWERLLDKLVEETAELRVASTEGEQREELADVLEVVARLPTSLEATISSRSSALQRLLSAGPSPSGSCSKKPTNNLSGHSRTRAQRERPTSLSRARAQTSLR